MGMDGTILFGTAALTAVFASVALLSVRRYALSIIFGVLTMFFVVLSACNWRLALIDSGKDPAWLGFARYPAALITLAVLLCGALVSMAFSAHYLRKRREGEA